MTCTLAHSSPPPAQPSRCSHFQQLLWVGSDPTRGSPWAARGRALGGRASGQGAVSWAASWGSAVRPRRGVPSPEPLPAAQPAWGAVPGRAAVFGSRRPVECRRLDSLVTWFFIVGGLTVPWPLPAASELGIRAGPSRGLAGGAACVAGLLLPAAGSGGHGAPRAPWLGGRPPGLGRGPGGPQSLSGPPSPVWGTDG